MEPIKLEIFIDDKTRAGLQSASGNIGGMEKQMQQVINVLEQDLKGLQQAFKEAMSQGVSGQKELAEIQALRGEVNKLKEELKSLKKQKEETNSVSVVDDKVFVGMDDIAKKTNNLKLQFSQVARELPALAMGPQMFILAISNNLPMLADAIKDVRMQNELLKASGQKSVPVWKQLAGSLFSWQTVLVAAISLGIVFGKDIWEWVKTLGKASDKLDEAKKKAEMFTSVMNTQKKSLKSSNTEYGRQMAVLAKLKGEWDKLGDSMDRKKKFINENKTEFKELGVRITGVNDAENLLVKNTTAFVEAMKLRARALAGQSTLQDLYAKKQEEDDNAEFNRKLAKVRRANPHPSDIKEAKDRNTGPGYVSGPGITSPLVYKDSKKRDWTPQDIANEYVDKVYKKREEEAEKRSKLYQSHIDRISKKMIQDFQNSQKTLNDAEIEEDNGTGKTSGKSASDYQNELADARIRARQKLEAARIAIMTDGYKKRQALARQELDETIASIDKEERDTLKKMQEKKKKGVKIAPEEEQEVTANANLQRALATDRYIKEYYRIEEDWRGKNLQSWIDYNKEYGTLQQKRLAITQDYNRRMMEEGLTDGERATLAKELETELRELNMQEFKDSINFADVFGDLDAQSTEALSALRDKLKEFINNSAKDLKPDDLRSLQDAFRDIDFEIKDRTPFRELKKDLADYRSAQAEVEKAQTELNQAVKFGSLLIEEYDEATGEVTRRLLTRKEAEKNLTDAQKKRKEALSGLVKSMGGMAGEISNIANAANSIVSTFDMLGMEVGEDVRGVVEGFSALSDGISNVVSAAQSGDIAGVLAGAVGAVGGAVKTLGSLFGADWGGEKSRRKYEEAKAKYESYMTVLDQVIGKQKELVASMEADDFANADNSYERARQLLKKQQDYAREMGKAYLNSGASKGFLGIGSSSSEGVKQRKGISSSAWEQARKALGNDYSKVADGRMTGLFDLSYEKLVKLRDEASGFWAELHRDTQNYLNQIIESEEAWQEVQKARKEALTKVDFDSFYDSFVSKLADMDSTSEDFAKNFEKYLQNAIFSALVAQQYKGRIEALYNAWAGLAESDGKLEDTEAEWLKQQYGKIVKDMLAEREQVMKDFGWTASASSQSGQAGTFTAMSQEQGTKLEGLFTSLQNHASGIHKLMEDLQKGREEDEKVFAAIAENTSYCKLLKPLLDIWERMDRNGIKITG